MGRRSGITVGGYHPQIFTMHLVMAQREILADDVERAMNKKKMRSMYWNQRLANAMPSGWEAWFDNDANIPADADDKQMAYLVEERVRFLIGSSYPTITARIHRGIFVWTDELGVYVYSKEVGKRALYALEFSSKGEAKAFLNGLPFDNRGYGVVLDILPAAALANVERVDS